MSLSETERISFPKTDDRMKGESLQQIIDTIKTYGILGV